jgi:hypothetical protein
VASFIVFYDANVLYPAELRNFLMHLALIGIFRAHDPPSKTFYDPERDGVRCSSLGVHEHWNNGSEKKYSGNLSKPNGIELFQVD